MSVQDAKVPPAPPKLPPHQDTYLTLPGERGARGGLTFQYEASLPSLPLPPLQDTLDLYLYSVRPHVTEAEFEVTKIQVEAFASGAGPRLQQRLAQRQLHYRNWLEDWWLQNAYLSFREPLLPKLNTSGPHPLSLSLWRPSLEKAFEYGSLYLWSLLEFYQLLREERFRPHTTREGKPLSMEQFRWIFNCSRIPGHEIDSLHSCWKTKAEGECPQHIIVLCKGHVWKLYPWDAKGAPLTPPELEAQLQQVWDRCAALGPGAGVAALTCDRRQVWAQNREWLKSISISNTKNLEAVETAAFITVLDESCPEGLEQVFQQGLCGDTTNRWADKSMCSILTRNGYITSNNDHTPYDAMVTVIISHYQHLLLQHMGGVWRGPGGVRAGLQPPLPLPFQLDHRLREAVQEARRTSRLYTEDVGVKPFIFTEYGRDFLRPLRLHPDSYVQMALQLAYYRVHGRPAPTYETASTRQFYHGRTETLRSCTPEATAWVRAMLDPDTAVSERRQGLERAIARHNELRERCESGLGVDRHLLGLYLTALEEGEEVPAMFSDPAFFKSGGGGNFTLSTSIIGYTPAMGGVAAMTPDGYGCFYSIQRDRISVILSHYRSGGTDGDSFKASLTQALQDMKTLYATPRAAL